MKQEGFHVYAKIQTEQGIIDDPADHILDFYKELYNVDNISSDSGELLSVIPSLVTDEENSFLSAIPSFDEVKSTGFSMDPHSAPGLDAFSGLIFQHCWDIVGNDLVSMAFEIFGSSQV